MQHRPFLLRSLFIVVAMAWPIFAQSPLPADQPVPRDDRNSQLAHELEEDARITALIVSQFNTITPENVLKWALVHPAPDKYDFEAPDAFVAFGEKQGMFIVGHTLVWHNQTPA